MSTMYMQSINTHCIHCTQYLHGKRRIYVHDVDGAYIETLYTIKKCVYDVHNMYIVYSVSSVNIVCNVTVDIVYHADHVYIVHDVYIVCDVYGVYNDIIYPAFILYIVYIVRMLETWYTLYTV